MSWISVKDKLPLSGVEVLTLKRFLYDNGWTEPIAFLDSGWHRTGTFENRFEWNKGGETLYWYPLPKLPKPSDKPKEE